MVVCKACVLSVRTILEYVITRIVLYIFTPTFIINEYFTNLIRNIHSSFHRVMYDGKHFPLPLLYNAVPGGQCSCNECFERASNGTCVEVECEDWRYDQQELACQDSRPKQLTAFLLSLFLSSTGAANFYIGRDDLGVLYVIWTRYTWHIYTW